MKKLLALFLALILSLAALAGLAETVASSPEAAADIPDMETLSIIPDSSTRNLTKRELWQYSYETLGYIRNEILARHGYAFINEKFFVYFNAKPWYTAGNFTTMSEMLTDVEYDNIRRVYEMEATMKERGTYNSTGIDIDDIIAQQNALGGYGNQNDYGNFKGNGEGKHFSIQTEAQRLQELRDKYVVEPQPRYVYTTQYIIPDSNTRALTAGELWAYTRESLRYIRNEILARHGYVFGDNKFGRYFSTKDWYVAGNYDDDTITSLEWYNIGLLHDIERIMDELKTENETGLDITVIIQHQNSGNCPG